MSAVCQSTHPPSPWLMLCQWQHNKDSGPGKMEALQWRTRSLTESISIRMSSAENAIQQSLIAMHQFWHSICAFACVSVTQSRKYCLQSCRCPRFLEKENSSIVSRHFMRSWRMTTSERKLVGHKENYKSMWLKFYTVKYSLPSMFHNHHSTSEKWKKKKCKTLDPLHQNFALICIDSDGSTVGEDACLEQDCEKRRE